MDRRHFLIGTGVAGAGLSIAAEKAVAIIVDPRDPVASAPPVQWAVKELSTALGEHGIATAPKASFAIEVSGSGAGSEPESAALIPSKGRLKAAGSDVRGAMYAVLEVADRVRNSSAPLEALQVRSAVSEQPANRIRSVTRLFCSDVEDKGWFNDREMWPRYLTMLATQRFNRFHLSLGIGFDFLRSVTEAYFLYAYPFFLDVPGYKVRVPQLPNAERDSNLAMLRYISEQTVARGMEFQLGIWTHGYEWINSPNPNYTIEGLTKETHAAYSRDAVRALLQACPAITGVTFRVHGESGVEEGSYDFWKTVFEGVRTCGRKVSLDMHSKGMDQTMLDLGVSTGLPLTVSPKYWAEHLGMPYHQADIRELERPQPGRTATGLMRFSAGSRSFTRYGYADLMREDRKWGVLHRIWPGTQRLLLWGDPVTAAAYSRAFRFCGSDGVEIMEPLSFKGRRGSGRAGDRCGYADASLKPRWDWEKYEYSHRVWGRLLYNPECDGDVWRRSLNRQFGAGAKAAENALANVSRILPIVTTAHGASAANNTYWPEVYTNQPLIEGSENVYSDTPAPRVFGNVSPFDPELFYRINDYADDLLKGERSGRYTPVEVAAWIEGYAATGAKSLAEFEARSTAKKSPEHRRLALDVAIQSGLGRFFGAKFRAGVLYRMFEKTGSREALEESLKQYQAAMSAFAELANRAREAYVPDLTVGERPFLRGHWMDRLPAMEADIAAVQKKLAAVQRSSSDARVAAAIREVLGNPQRAVASVRHTQPSRFRAGQALDIELGYERRPVSVVLHYRHVNQAERFVAAPMEMGESRSKGVIPATYTDSHYPLQYYFEIRMGEDAVALYPGLGRDLVQQPYFVVRRS